MGEPIIQFEHVFLGFNGHEVLQDVSFRIEKGQTVLLVGGSGVGKTTILKLILNLLKPDKGEIYLMGKNIHSISTEELDQLRRRSGLVFQNGALFDTLTVEENVGFFLYENQNFTKQDIRERVREILQPLGMESAMSQYPEELSGGMVRRVAIARAIIYNPELLLYDEPTSGLDPLSSKKVIELMDSLKKDYNHTSLIVTHEIYHFLDIVQRLIVLMNGSIVYDGDVDPHIFDHLESKTRNHGN